MLEYDRINISEGIDVNETSASKNVIFVTFKDAFKCELYLYIGCYDLIQEAMSFNDVAIVYVQESAYRIYFWYLSKDDAINIMNNSNLVDKKGVL